MRALHLAPLALVGLLACSHTQGRRSQPMSEEPDQGGGSPAFYVSPFKKSLLGSLAQGGMQGSGSSGVSLSAANTWTAAQTISVGNDASALIVGARNRVCLNASCTYYIVDQSNAATLIINSANGIRLDTGGEGVELGATATRKLKFSNSSYTEDLTIGATGTEIDDSYAASSSIDFAGVTDACEDSGNITVTGAAVNDVCSVGPPAALPHANSWVGCRVTATNTVVVRHCAHGASGDPASATYTVRVFDP